MHAALDAARQVWPAFALVTGLLLIGVVAERDGLFRWTGAFLAQLPLGARGLLAAAFALVAVVTALLNLDTAVFFLTPVLLHLARARGLDEAPFLYGAVFMSNAASLYLPGSNLTNLIVLHGEHVSGATFLARTWAAALTATLVTGALLAILFRGELARGSSPACSRSPCCSAPPGAGGMARRPSSALRARPGRRRSGPSRRSPSTTSRRRSSSRRPRPPTRVRS